MWITIIIMVFIVTESKIISLCVSNLLLFLNLYRPIFFINNIIADLGAGLFLLYFLGQICIGCCLGGSEEMMQMVLIGYGIGILAKFL